MDSQLHRKGDSFSGTIFLLGFLGLDSLFGPDRFELQTVVTGYYLCLTGPGNQSEPSQEKNDP